MSHSAAKPTSLHPDIRSSYQRTTEDSLLSREVDPHGLQPQERTKIPSKTPHGAKGVVRNSQEAKDKVTHIKNTTRGNEASSISADGSGEEKVVKVVVLHKSTDDHASKHPASHDPKKNHSSSGSHDPEANRSSSAHKQTGGVHGQEVSTSGHVKRRSKLDSQSNYEEDDIDIPQSKGMVHYMEDLHNMQEVTMVNMGRSGFTQDTPDFLSAGSGEEKTVRYGDQGTAPVEKLDKSHPKEKKKKQSEKPSSKSESPAKDRSIAEAWAHPDPKGCVAVSPTDPLSPASSSTSQGSPLGRSHSSPPEVRLRRELKGKEQQGQSARSTEDNHFSPPPTVLNSDHDPTHKDTPHSDSSPEQKSKSIFKRFSDSFMRARSRSQQQKSPETTSWYFADPSREPNFALPSTVIEQRLDALTEKERQAVVEDLEIIPRAQSLQHLGGPVVKASEGAVFGGEGEGHAQISLNQVKVSSNPSLPHGEDDDDLKTSSAPALLRFAKDRKGLRRQSNSQTSINDPVVSPTDPHTREHLTRSAEDEATPTKHQATPMEHLEGSVEKGVGGADDSGKSDQKPRKKSFFTNLLHKTKKPSSDAPENAAHTSSTATTPTATTPTATIPTATIPTAATPTAATKTSAAAAKHSPVTARNATAVAAKNAPGSPVAAKKLPVGTKSSSRGSPIGGKMSQSSPVAAKNSPIAAKKSLMSNKYSPNSPTAVRNSPLAARKLPGSPDAVKRSPISAGPKSTLAVPKRISAETQPSSNSAQSPTSKRISAPSLASKKQSTSSSSSKKQSSSSSSSLTQHSGKQNFDLTTSPVSSGSLQSPVFASPMHRKRKVGVPGPSSPLTPPSTPLSIVISQQVSDAAARPSVPPDTMNQPTMNQPLDLDALLRAADAKLSSLQDNVGMRRDPSKLTLSPPMSPLPSLMADHFSATPSSHSRQSSGEVDIDDVPSPTGGASQKTPEHHVGATHLPPKSSKIIPHLVLSREKGEASVVGARPTAHFDFSDAVATGSSKQSTTFTAALPPRPPSKRWNSVESALQPSTAAESTRLALSDASVLSKKKSAPPEIKAQAKSTLRRSTKGSRISVKKKISSKDIANAQPISKSSISRVKSPDLPLTRDGTLKVTPSEGTLKRTSDSMVVMKHTAVGSGTLKRTSDSGTLKRGSMAMHSVRSSLGARPSSATTAGRKSTGTKETHSPSHLSVKRVSSGERAVQRDSATRLSKSHSSMRAPSGKTGTLPRGQHGGVALSQGDASHHKISQGTLSRKSIRRASDDIAVFNQISAEASVLKSSDHRRQIRPAFRQKPSAGHLKMLHNRQNVSSEFSASPDAPGNAESPQTTALDPNLYSTYMSKKRMDPAAITGLAIKLDFTTVKLKKTGIVSEQAGGGGEVSGEAEASIALGEEMNTKHNVLLLMVKGRRYVQTYLVEPTASSLNSGDVFLCVSGKCLFHWVGKSANVIEKARGADIVSRILNKKELNCQANRICTIEEGVDIPDRDTEFWSLLGGKQGVKSSESTHADEVYERGVIAATRVYELQEEGSDLHFVPCHASSQQMLKHAMLDTKKIFLLDFVSEVYVWVGRQSPTKLRKRALELGKAHFDGDCKPAVFQHVPARTSVARASGRLRKNSLGRQSKHNLNASIRKTSKDAKPMTRPSWALFARVVEGGESILLREKFSDWPEQGRLIKMKGHEASVKLMVPSPLAELKPADVEKMLKPTAPFEGLRLGGGQHPQGEGKLHGLALQLCLQSCEDIVHHQVGGYVIRWAFRITVVKELEGLTPGAGQFAQDKKYQRSLQGAKADEETKAKTGGGSDSESEDNNNEECRKLLESGGRDRCAYFFWQGSDCTVNEKGAAALMTIELDKEKGPQIRVVQGKEPPAFLTLFKGKMVVLRGRSDKNSFQTPAASDGNVKMYSVRGQEKEEAFLLELDATSQSLAGQLRSRGCYIIHHVKSSALTLWVGCKSTLVLQKVAQKAIKCLRNRLGPGDVATVQEGHEANSFWASIGERNCYMSLLNDPQPHDFTPRLYELTSTTGEFTASEVLYAGRNNCTDAFPFLQDDIYGVVQPAMFLLDVFTEIYVWIGWWPVIENQLLKDANATTGSAHSRWLQDKKLALETALLYSKACGRPKAPPPVYLVHAGTEHQSFVNHFPFWIINTKVQELNCKERKPIPQRMEAEEELKKYSRTKFTLEELKKRPLPEGVDPAKLEVYLCDEEFDKIFKMSREEFVQQPIWKKTTLKKQAGLF
ncbi:hypothetical protein EMCRGX_G034199 [Ephydatia muelleri]